MISVQKHVVHLKLNSVINFIDWHLPVLNLLLII